MATGNDPILDNLGMAHLGSPKAIPAVRRDLAARKDRWLHKAAKAMLKVTLEDWKVWRRKSGSLPKAK